MKNLKVTVNGVEYNVKVEEEGENSTFSNEREENIVMQSEENLKFATKEASNLGEAVEAPMSGTIVSVNTQNGKSVKKGDVLLVLEAMKMENEIVSPRDGVVEKINVQNGKPVNAGDALLFLK